MPDVRCPMSDVRRPTLSVIGYRLSLIGDRVSGIGYRVSGLVQTASDNDVKLKSFTFSAGITMAPPPSVPARRIDGPIASMLFSMNSGDSLKRKFLIAFEILPFSIRKVPSRVRPVNRIVRGST